MPEIQPSGEDPAQIRSDILSALKADVESSDDSSEEESDKKCDSGISSCSKARSTHQVSPPKDRSEKSNAAANDKIDTAAGSSVGSTQRAENKSKKV